MAGFGDRLSAMKAKQEAGTAKKAEAGEAERKAQEKTENKGKLMQRRDAVRAALVSAEKQKSEAEAAIDEADAFAKEQGDNLDPEAKAEIDELKAEAGEAFKAYEALQSELKEIDEELALEGVGEEGTKTETTVAETTSKNQDWFAALVEQKKVLDSLEKRFQKFNEKNLGTLGDEIEMRINKLYENFNEGNLEKINALLEKMEKDRMEFFSFAGKAISQIKKEDPTAQGNIKRAIIDSERRLTGLIHSTREMTRQAAINKKGFDLPGQQREKIQNIGERGLVGEAELQKMFQLDMAINGGDEEDALYQFRRRFNTGYHGGMHLWNMVTDSGISFLEGKKGAFKKYPTEAAEFDSTLKTIKSAKELREQKIQSSPKGIW